MTLSVAHREYLLAAAISESVLDASGIDTREKEPVGIVFPWDDGSGEVIPQLRPDSPVMNEKGKPVKYRFPTGAKMILNRLRDSGQGPALIVEGTKQQYTALSYAPPEYAVYGLSGCWNWVDADLSWAMGREVYVLFDGDLISNRDVHKAATDLAEKLDLSGASAVKFVRTTARGSDGLDDVLAKVPEDKRADYLALWIGKALPKLPKAPAKKEGKFFEKGSLQVQQATKSLLEGQPAALTAERKVALYLGGSYHIDGTAFLAAVSKQLGDQYRPAWRNAMEEMAVGLLFDGALLLPERNAFAKLNCTNGMLDLRTLELTAHSPEFLSTIQIPVKWDPDAKAPHYEAWLEASCPAQVDDLEEVAGTMLDPTRTPHKAAFLFGPSRSGKSTFLRLLQEIAGVENRTSVTLHALAQDRFAAANVYGKMINAAADLSSAHVEDLSVFKMMTGEDAIHGNRKYGAQFTFTNQALFAFSANELPTVSESSRAYAERIKPFEFPHSFAGREDAGLEGRLRGELQGILVRWVHAYRRVLERGGYTVTDARVRKEFETRSDRVAQWIADACTITPASYGQELPDHQCTGRRESARAFNQWADRNGGSRMGERRVFDRLGHIPGVTEVRAGRNRGRGFNIVVKDDPNSDLHFSPEGPEERAEVRAVRAVSEHPAPTTSSHHQGPDSKIVEGGEEVQGEGALKVPEVSVTARAPFALGFDIETASAAQLYTGGHEGDFVRLCGLVADDIVVDSSARILVRELNEADVIYGHNILGFDLQALARHHGADYDALAAKSVDTLVLARLADPPGAKGASPDYGLDSVAQRLGHAGKSDDLKALAKEHGGYDKIPVDDERYRSYLYGDLAATRHVYEELTMSVPEALTSYVKREMKVAAIQNRMTLNGWGLNTELLAARVTAEDRVRELSVNTLRDHFGMPTERVTYKLLPKAEWPSAQPPVSAAVARRYMGIWPEAAVARGLAVRKVRPYDAPWATDAGREALERALRAAGAVHLPTTATGALALSSDALGGTRWYDAKQKRAFPGLLQEYGHLPEVREIAELITAATGATAKYAEIAKFVTPEGRVHGSIGDLQASGRWAMVRPSLTNLGKRGAKVEQRRVFDESADGMVHIACDLSQVDMRALAGLSQDPAYMALFEPGRDAHMDMAEVYFGARTKANRERTKAINHGLNYGQGAAAVAERNGLDPSLVDAAVLARSEAYPRLMEWTEEVRQLGASGQLLDNGFGRLMRCDPERAWTQAPALMGQGAARDLMCEGLLRLVARDSSVTQHLRGVVHDEVVLCVPREEAEYWRGELAEAFTFEWRGVPILCEVSPPGASWTDCYAGE